VKKIKAIGKTSKNIKRLIDEYKKSLKPKETEEVINQVLNRPLAFLTAKFFNKLGRSPNFVTFISMFFGVSSGFCFAKGEYPYTLLGGILLELMIIFDCADGQLARMSAKASSFGKTIDALADICTHMSIFYGVAFAQYIKIGHIYPFFFALFAQLSMYLHIMLYDHFKNVFINITKPDYKDKLESLDELKEKYNNAKKNRGMSLYKRIITKIYYLFYKLESYVVTIGYLPLANNFYDILSEPDKIDPYIRDMYYREMKTSVKLWSFIGDSMHLSIFVVAGIFNKISLIFPLIIGFTNLFMIFNLFYQRAKFKKFGLEREMLWQARFE